MSEATWDAERHRKAGRAANRAIATLVEENQEQYRKWYAEFRGQELSRMRAQGAARSMLKGLHAARYVELYEQFKREEGLTPEPPR